MTTPMVTVEDHFFSGGFGSAVLEFAAERHGHRARILRQGIADRPRQPLAATGVGWADREKIAERVARKIESRAVTKKVFHGPVLTTVAG